MFAKITVSAFALVLACGAAAAQSNGPTWKDAAGNTFTITSTPPNSRNEILGTVTMAVPPAPGCNAVGVPTPFIGYAHSLPIVHVHVVNWMGPGCNGVTVWMGTLDKQTNLTSTWTYMDKTQTLTGTDVWIRQHDRRGKK